MMKLADRNIKTVNINKLSIFKKVTENMIMIRK